MGSLKNARFVAARSSVRTKLEGEALMPLLVWCAGKKAPPMSTTAWCEVIKRKAAL
jgi:hypothetical protein